MTTKLQEFITANNLGLTLLEVGQSTMTQGIEYIANVHNGDHVAGFTFHGSGYDAERGKLPTLEDIMGCLMMDALSAESSVDDLALDLDIRRPSEAIALKAALDENRAKLERLLGPLFPDAMDSIFDA